MYIHILGICGTFMSGLAAISKSLGHVVSGSDSNVYPPMSYQLQHLGIDIDPNYNLALIKRADIVVIGNVMTRGMPVIEFILNNGVNYTSGPEFLKNYILPRRNVLAVSGTHGKTTTSSLLAWILEVAELNPGFLIGGIPNNFNVSARIGSAPYFVIEADEYDTAFFDKRAKFVHYNPQTLIINNLEFDHADIFNSLDEIQKQFHYLLRIMPEQGLVIYPENVEAIEAVLKQGLWSKSQTFSLQDWDSNFSCDALMGDHNKLNTIAAVFAARSLGIAEDVITQALLNFTGVKRRLEKIQDNIYTDFAHHPTAISNTLGTIKAMHPEQQVIAVVDFASNTMRKGSNAQNLPEALKLADFICFFNNKSLDFSLEDLLSNFSKPWQQFNSVDAIKDCLITKLNSDAVLLIMSNSHLGVILPELLNKNNVAEFS